MHSITPQSIQRTIPTPTPEAISAAIEATRCTRPEPVYSPLLAFLLDNKPLVWAIVHDMREPREIEVCPELVCVMTGVVFGGLFSKRYGAIDPAELDRWTADEILWNVLRAYIPDADWIVAMQEAQNAWHEQHKGQVADGGSA